MKILRHRADFRSVVFVLFLFVAMALQWSAVFRHPLLYFLLLVELYVWPGRRPELSKGIS